MYNCFFTFCGDAIVWFGRVDFLSTDRLDDFFTTQIIDMTIEEIGQLSGGN